MNYSVTYNDVIDAFGMILQQDNAEAVGIMVTLNIVVKNKTHIHITEIERKNILGNHQRNN